MSDDLVRRLRDVAEFEGLRVAEEAADRIEELEERLKAATDDAKEAEAYAVELEAKLAKAVSRLDKLAYWLDIDQDLWDALTAMEQSDHRRAQSEVQAIKDILTGGPKNGNE